MISHADKKQRPSALMGKQIRAAITMSFATEKKFCYKRSKEAEPERAKFILQKGQNTAVLEEKKKKKKKEKRAANISSWWSI